ncbi:MAG: hypothetical protein ACOCPM_05940, partial [Bacteroidales bacterium]
MTIYISVLLSIISLFACEKDELKDNKPPGVTPEEPFLDVVWRKAVYNDTAGAYYHPPKFAGDYVVFCSKSTFDGKHAGGLAVYNKQTGERHPAWNHEPEFDGNYSINDFEVGGTNQDVLFINARKKLYAWDLTTGDEIWSRETQFSYVPESSAYGDIFFVTIRASGSKTWSELQAINAKTGVVREVLHETWE